MSNWQTLRYAKLAFIISLMLPLGCWAQTAHIKDGQAGEHVGQRVVVEGTLVGVYASRSGNTFLNFGAAYPNEDFTAVIFAENSGSIRNVQVLEGKRVEVSGVVRLYRGKPEIILRSAGELRVRD